MTVFWILLTDIKFKSTGLKVSSGVDLRCPVDLNLISVNSIQNTVIRVVLEKYKTADDVFEKCLDYCKEEYLITYATYLQPYIEQIAGQSLSSKHQAEMASISVPTPANQVAGGGGAGGAQAAEDQTSGGQTGELQIEDNYVAKPQSRLPIPHVFDKSHLSEIEKFNEEDHKFWSIQYAAARGFQATQTKILQTLQTEELERQKDIKAFQTPPREFLSGPTKSARKLRSQFKEQVTKLERINKTIASINEFAGRDEFFGQVHTSVLVEPRLNEQDDFELVTQLPELQRSLAKPYRKASDLQHYHRNYMKATTEGTRDKSIESRILDELSEINDDIDDFVKVALKERLRAEQKNEEQKLKRGQDGKVDKEEKKRLKEEYDFMEEKIEVRGLVYVPNEGQDDYTLPGFALEEDDDGSSDDDDNDAQSLMSGVSDKPHIEERGNGEDGQSEKEPLPKEIYEIRSRMGGRDGPLFTIIDAKLNGVEGNEAYNRAYEQLQSLANEQAKFCEAKNINPATYAVEDTQLDVFYKMVQDAVTCKNLLKAAPNDTNIMSQYTGLREVAWLFIQEHQWPETFHDTFLPTGDEILSIIAKEAAPPPAQPAPPPPQNAPPPAQTAPPPAPFGPPPSQTAPPPSLFGPRPSQTAPTPTPLAQNAPHSAETDAPPEEDTDEQCITYNSIPGVVVEIENGVKRHKRISGIRKCGFGHQLVLKSNGTNPEFKDRFIFELVPAKSFSGAFREYKAKPGHKTITTTTRNDIKGLPWSKVSIAGVMSQRRKDDKLYKIKSVTLVNIKFPGTGFMWASQSNLADEYGEYEVKSKIDRYLLESGQKAPKPPTERVFKLSKKELETQLRALSEDAKPRRKKAIKDETGMTRTRKYKKKAPLKSAHPRSKTAFPETDGEEEGDPVADESERSEDEDDSGSL